MVSPATRENVLWGVVAGLSFLVLVQGYELLGDERVTVLVKAGVAVLVALVAGVTAHLVRPHVTPSNEQA